MHLYGAHHHMRAKPIPVRADLAYRETLAGRMADGLRNILTVLLNVGK
jgi:hypothetical protein